MLPILCTLVVSTAWQLPPSRAARTSWARLSGCVTSSTSGVRSIGQNLDLKWQQLSSSDTNPKTTNQWSSHGQRQQHHRLSSWTANLKQQLAVHQHQKRPEMIRDRCATKSLCFKASKRTRQPKLAEPCEGSAHASSVLFAKQWAGLAQIQFVLRPATLAQFLTRANVTRKAFFA